MKVAIFADIHGKLLLPFTMVDRYQQETGERVDFILQCGDIGAFPDLDKLDKSTRKHALADRDELGFHDDFVQKNQTIANFLARLAIPMICVRGNHEDHDFLDALEAESGTAARFAIDAYGKVFVCKTGYPQELRYGTESLRLIGVGRIGDRKGRQAKPFIQAYEQKAIKTLIAQGEDFDLLLSHDTYGENQDDYGTAEIHQLLDSLIFSYHFYGHTGQPFAQKLAFNGLTQTVKVKELEFDASGNLPPACMLILEKSPSGNLSLSIVPDSFTQQFKRWNWRSLY